MEEVYMSTRGSTPKEKTKNNTNVIRGKNDKMSKEHKHFISDFTASDTKTNDNENQMFTPARTKGNNIISGTSPRVKLLTHNSNKFDLSDFDYIKDKKITNKSQNLCPLCGKKMETFDKDEVDNRTKVLIRKYFSENIINSNKVKDEKKKNKDLAKAKEMLDEKARKVVSLNRKLREEQRKFNDELDDKVVDNLELKSYLEQSNTTVNNLRQEKEEIELQMKNLKDENVELKKEIDSQKNNNLVLKWFRLTKNLVLKNQLTRRENDLSDTNSKMKNLEINIEKQQNEIDNLTEEKNKATKKVEKLEAENVKQKKLLEEDKNSLANKDNELKILQQNNNELQNQLNGLTKNQEGITKENNMIKMRNEGLKAEKGKANEKIIKLETENNSLKKENDSLNNQIKELKTKLDEQKRNYEKQQIKAAKLFLLAASKTNVEVNGILYFFAWLFQCIPCCKGYINKVRAVRNLNNKFDAFRNSLFLKNTDDIEKEMNKNTPKQADEIFCALDEFLPICDDVILFNQYVFIYCNLLDLYQHNTEKIYKASKNNLRIDFKWDVLKKKIEQLKVTNNALNDGSDIGNENIINTNNKDKPKSYVEINNQENDH